jgi:hypothetical protein
MVYDSIVLLSAMCRTSFNTAEAMEWFMILVVTSVAPAGLGFNVKLCTVVNPTKPRYGFGCIETDWILRVQLGILSTKPRYGFGCIETYVQSQ